MSVQSFKAFVAGLAEPSDAADAFRASLADGQALAAYASAHGHAISPREAEGLIDELRLGIAGAEELTEHGLDQVTGGRRTQPPSRRDIEIE